MEYTSMWFWAISKLYKYGIIESYKVVLINSGGWKKATARQLSKDFWVCKSDYKTCHLEGCGQDGVIEGRIKDSLGNYRWKEYEEVRVAPFWQFT